MLGQVDSELGMGVFFVAVFVASGIVNVVIVVAIIAVFGIVVVSPLLLSQCAFVDFVVVVVCAS